MVMAGAHFGNWEMYLQAFTWRGYPMTVVQRQHHNELINQFITDKRQANGAELIDFHRRRPESFRQCLEALKKGRILALLVDVEGADEAAKQTEPYWKLYSGGDR